MGGGGRWEAGNNEIRGGRGEGEAGKLHVQVLLRSGK